MKMNLRIILLIAVVAFAFACNNSTENTATDAVSENPADTSTAQASEVQTLEEPAATSEVLPSAESKDPVAEKPAAPIVEKPKTPAKTAEPAKPAPAPKPIVTPPAPVPAKEPATTPTPPVKPEPKPATEVKEPEKKPEPPAPAPPKTTPAPAPAPATPAAGNWTVPASYLNMVNPVKADAASLSTGKSLYTKHCASCHGKSGLGDGPKAATLDTPSGDFSSNAFHNQTDGSLFYKTAEGRGDMPGYKKKIPEKEDMWSIVNYMRSFKK